MPMLTSSCLRPHGRTCRDPEGGAHEHETRGPAGQPRAGCPRHRGHPEEPWRPAALLVAGQQEIIKLLTPEPKDGPSLDELLGHVIGQQTELLGYARQIVKSQAQMEQNLPGDVVRAMGADTAAGKAINGAGRDGRRP